MRDLEAQLGRAQKAESDMRQKMQRHRLEMESILEKAEAFEEQKKSDLLEYDKKNKRGLTSQMTEKKPPVKSGKAIFKSKREMAQEAEAKMFEKMNGDAGGSTFLTGLNARKAKSAQKKRSTTTSVAESDSHIDEEELRDQVFDYDQSK